MRISDWSSDVCSSDLGCKGRPRSRTPGAPLRIIDLGRFFGGAEEDRTPDLRIANATLSQLSYRPPVPGRTAPGRPSSDRRYMEFGRREIGRSSCRERVCPYV